ncbi:hypothetical protein CQA18_26115, partial [Enterobacter hormaechei]|uniref:hypothetical protein n=1 Tax=Enterobacter hormaechei TaxID=158836 RepID=UPI000BD16A63
SKQATIALVGPMADSQRDVMGSWSAAGVVKQSVTLREGLERAVGDKARILYAKGANVTSKQATIALVGPMADSQRDVMGSWSAAGVVKQSV